MVDAWKNAPPAGNVTAPVLKKKTCIVASAYNYSILDTHTSFAYTCTLTIGYVDSFQ